MTVEASAAAAVQAASTPSANQLNATAPSGTTASSSISFSDLLQQGVQQANTKLIAADSMIQNFALDGSTPIHEVTHALEQARLSFELMLQIRNRAVESYQQLMNMQI